MYYDTFGTCNGFASSLRSGRCRFKPPALSLAKLSARKNLTHTHTHVHSLRVLHRTLHICPDINVCLLDAHGLLLVMGNRAAIAVAKRLGSDAAPEPKSAFSTLMQRLLHSTCKSCSVQAPLEVAAFQSSHAGPVGVRTSAAVTLCSVMSVRQSSGVFHRLLRYRQKLIYATSIFTGNMHAIYQGKLFPQA